MTRRCDRRTRPRTIVSSDLFTSLELSIAGVTAELPVNRDAVGLALAELKRDPRDLDGAIDVVEQLEPTTYSAVSLAKLYSQTERWDVIELTEGSRTKTTLRRCCAWPGLPAEGIPRRRARGSERGHALALSGRADPAPCARRARPELPCPGQERDGAEGSRAHFGRGLGHERVREQVAELSA